MMAGSEVIETSVLASLLSVRERMKEKKNGALKSAKLNTSIAAKIKTKIINNSSILKISLKHNNKALAMALTDQKEKCRRKETECMYLQKEIKMVHFHNANLRQNLSIVNKTLKEMELFMNSHINNAIEISGRTEFSPESQRNSDCLSRSSEIPLDDDCISRYAAVARRVPTTQVNASKLKDSNSEAVNNTSNNGIPRPTTQFEPNTDAICVVSRVLRGDLSCTEQCLVSTQVLVSENMNSDDPTEAKRSRGYSAENLAYVTQRKKRSTLSLSSNPSSADHEPKNYSFRLSNLCNDSNGNNCPTELADEQIPANSSLKPCSGIEKQTTLDTMQPKEQDQLYPEETVYDAEMDLTSSDSGSIATIASKGKNADTDSTVSTSRSEKCDGTSWRKVRYSQTEKKLKHNLKVSNDQRPGRTCKTKIKDVTEANHQPESQIEIRNPVDSLVLESCSLQARGMLQCENNIRVSSENNIRDSSENNIGDSRRTYVVPVMHPVKQEKFHYYGEEETEQITVCEIPEVQNQIKNKSLSREPCNSYIKPSQEIPYRLPSQEMSSNMKEEQIVDVICKKDEPPLEEKSCVAVGRKKKQKVSQKTTEREVELESSSAGVSSTEKRGDFPNVDIFEDQSSQYSLNGKQNVTHKASGNRLASLESYTAKRSSLEENQIVCVPTLQEKPSSKNATIKRKVSKNVCESLEPELHSNIENISPIVENQVVSCSLNGKKDLSLGIEIMANQEKKTCNRITPLENSSAELFHFKKNLEISNVTVVQDKVKLKRSKNTAECREDPLQNDVLKGLPLQDSNTVSHMPTSPKKISTVSEKKKQVSMEAFSSGEPTVETCITEGLSFAQKEVASALTVFQENPTIAEKKAKQKVKKLGIRSASSENQSIKMTSSIVTEDSVNMPALQVNVLNVAETKASQICKKPHEGRETPKGASVKPVTFENRQEISNMIILTDKTCSTAVKALQSVNKNEDEQGPTEPDSEEKLISEDCKEQMSKPTLGEKPPNAIKKRGRPKIQKRTCDVEDSLISPLTKSNYSNIPVLNKKSKFLTLEEKQKSNPKNNEFDFHSSGENVQNCANRKKPNRKSSRTECKTSKIQKSRDRGLSCDEHDQHVRINVLETCDQDFNIMPTGRSTKRVSFAVTKGCEDKHRRETYVVESVQPETCPSSLLLSNSAENSHRTHVADASEPEAFCVKSFLKDKIVSNRRGTYVVCATPTKESLKGADSNDEKQQHRRETYFVRPIDNTSSSVSTCSALKEGFVENSGPFVCVTNFLEPKVFSNQIATLRRDTYVIPDHIVNFNGNSTCLSPQMQKNHASETDQENLSTSHEKKSKISTGVFLHTPLNRSVENCDFDPDSVEPNEDMIVPSPCLPVSCQSEHLPLDAFLQEILTKPQDSFMIEMISDSVLVDSMADYPSVLEFSNSTAQEDVPFSPCTSSDGFLISKHFSAERKNMEKSLLSKGLETPSETGEKEAVYVRKRPNYDETPSKDRDSKAEDVRKAKKALQDLTNIACSNNPSPKSCVKLEEESTQPLRRRRPPVNYAEPKLGSKLRRGDEFTNAEFLSSPIFRNKKKPKTTRKKETK